jgi:hypothetical protein
MGAKFLRGVRMGLLAARGTCKLSVVAHPHLNLNLELFDAGHDFIVHIAQRRKLLSIGQLQL